MLLALCHEVRFSGRNRPFLLMRKSWILTKPRNLRGNSRVFGHREPHFVVSTCHYSAIFEPLARLGSIRATKFEDARASAAAPTARVCHHFGVSSGVQRVHSSPVLSSGVQSCPIAVHSASTRSPMIDFHSGQSIPVNSGHSSRVRCSAPRLEYKIAPTYSTAIATKRDHGDTTLCSRLLRRLVHSHYHGVSTAVTRMCPPPLPNGDQNHHHAVFTTVTTLCPPP